MATVYAVFKLLNDAAHFSQVTGNPVNQAFVSQQGHYVSDVFDVEYSLRLDG
jgi:hypothetical protein